MSPCPGLFACLVAAGLLAGSSWAQEDPPQQGEGRRSDSDVTPPSEAKRDSLLDVSPEEILGLTERKPHVPIPDRSTMRSSLGAGVDYLVSSQEPDGAWGSTREPAHGFWSNLHTHRAWIAATTGLVIQALLEASEDGAALEAADKGLDFLVQSEPLKRPSDWDTDNTWGYVYALAGVNAALSHPRYGSGTARHAGLLALADRCLEGLSNYQAPDGGWGYYDFETRTVRPSWSTSFQTAAALVELCRARDHGLPVPAGMIDAAAKAVERCRLPSGAYDYSVSAIPTPGRATWINQVKGSLGRMQVCNLALVMAGSEAIDEHDLVAGLDLFFEHHRFLDIARGKPVPHEAYYYNSGYFYFFGHAYAAMVLEQLGPADQVKYRGRLAREIVKCQESDGSMWDFYLNTYHRAYGTAFGAMTLVRTLGREER